MLLRRLLFGLKAGLAAGVAMDVIDHLLYYIVDVHRVRSIDWFAIILYGHEISNFLDFATVQTLHLVFTAVLGALFMLIDPEVKSTNIYLKGLIWSVLVWVSAIVFTHFILPASAVDLSVVTLVFHLILASIYGIMLAAIIVAYRDLREGEQ